MRRFAIVVLMVLIGAGTLAINSTLAYTLFSGSNNCDQCHSGFDGYGSDTHQSHIGLMSCATCHVSNGDNPEINNCVTCHDSNLLWNYHLQFAGDDGNGLNCGSCHAITPTQSVSWDEVKSMYLGSLENDK